MIHTVCSMNGIYIAQTMHANIQWVHILHSIHCMDYIDTVIQCTFYVMCVAYTMLST